MDVSQLLNVNPVLVDRVRLAIMANLALVDSAVEFTTLLQELDLTKGNLSSHMRKLEDAGMVKVHKEFVARKPRTTYRCTKKGKQEMQNYLVAVEAILKKTKT